jgi:hypothetical protein
LVAVEYDRFKWDVDFCEEVPAIPQQAMCEQDGKGERVVTNL